MDLSTISRSDAIEINRYLTHLIKCDRKPAAITYKSMLYAFACWIGARGKTFDTFLITDVEEYISGITNNSTSNTFLGAIKGYMKFRCGTLSFTDPKVMAETQRVNQLSLLRSKPKRSKREKTTLDVDELKLLLDVIKRRNKPIFYAGTLLNFYFGARPTELEYHIRTSGVSNPATISWDKCEMQLWTSKVKFYRYLPFHPDIKPYLKTWVKAAPHFIRPGEYITQKLRRYEPNGMRVTARTARKTVQTQLRLAHVDDFLIDCILGHVSRNSSIGDVYTDFQKFQGSIRKVMTEDHYMIVGDVL